MSSDFDQGLAQIRQFRDARARQEAALLQNRNWSRRLEAELEELLRSGGSESAVRATRQSLSDARAERKSLLDAVAERELRIAGTVGELAADVSPEALFGQMEGTVPIALLPVRLETRFFSDSGGDELRIRIYPDQIHVDNHPPELLPQERELGEEYWRIRRAGDPEQRQAAWIRLAQQFSPTRAAWIVQTLTPTNLDDAGDDLDFPDVPERLDGAIHVPRARLLPERWVALGFEGDPLRGYTALWTKWGETIPDSLHVGLSFDELAEQTEADDALPIDDEMRWTVDYEAACKVGMAITVEERDLAPGRNLAAGVDLLVVLGTDWTFSPAEGADNLANLFIAHQYSDGMAFVPQGTPTNNTGAARSGLSTDPVALAREIDPLAGATPGADHPAALRMTSGLGLPDEETLSRVPNSGLQEQTVSSTMIDALWEGSLGYYLDEMMDPLASDAFIDLARDHAASFLQPSGPYAGFRIGRQPYGLIPIVALDGFEPDRADGVEAMLARILRMLIGYWRVGLDRVPYMGKSPDPEPDLLALLQQNATSVTKRFRRVMDSETVANTKGNQGYATNQANMARALIFTPFASTIAAKIGGTKLAQMVSLPTHRPLFGPWVQAGELEPGAPLAPNYIEEIIDDIRDGAEGRKRLHERTKSRILLEALLAYAALRELDRAGSKVLDEHLVETGQLAERPPKSTLTTRSLTGIYSPVAAAGAGEVLVETPEQQASLVIPGVTEDLTLSEFLSSRVSGGQQPETPASLRNLETFVASLEQLATYPAAEIDRTFRGVLDAYSYRLDAWLTSLASRRLEHLRESNPVGVYVGGYGWVEDLRPDVQPDSLGYIHTPSIAHASTAAIMRSGHLAHRGFQNSGKPVEAGSPESALSIDLSSERVRRALVLLDGVAQGQSLAELLGYRFERQLRDRDPRLMQFVLPLRKIAPLRSTVPDASSATAEELAVRDVVDGVRLLEEWRQDSESLLDRIEDPTPGPGQRRALAQELARLDDMLDAVSDVLVAESVFQTVRGNYERAGAALSALDRQTRPPDPQVVRTPRSGLVYQQRVLLLVQEDGLPDTWNGLPGDLRAAVGPRLNAWIAGVLGDPSRVELAAQVRDGNDSSTETATLTEFLTEQQLSALSLVLLSVAADSRGPSELELALARFFATRVQDPTEEMTLELLEEPVSADGDELVGLGALHALLQMIHAVISQPRSAGARDFVPAGTEAAPSPDTEELRTRLGRASDALDAAVDALTGAVGGGQPQLLRDALRQAFDLGAPGAIPEAMGSDAAAGEVLNAQAERVLDGLTRTQAKLTRQEKDFQESGQTDGARVADHLIQQIHTIFGDAFPILPLFTLVAPQELAASHGDQQALVMADDLAPITWLQQMAMVRPQIQDLVSVLTAGEMLGTSLDPADFHVMQLPHTPGQAWAALSLPESSPEVDREPSLALLAVGRFALERPLAGIVCDGWTEVIPARTETTGLGFHYDAPAARPPQAILLAVPPAVERERWDLGSVLDSVLHSFELAKLRAVGPKELPALGNGVLPMLYIPQDRTKQRPSIDLEGIADSWQAQAGEILGKMNTHAF